MMSSQNVQVVADVKCTWGEVPPTYRLFVNDELFAERTWIWRDQYLEELIQILAEPGDYTLRYEVVSGEAVLDISNIRVEEGPAVVNGYIIRINDENP